MHRLVLLVLFLGLLLTGGCALPQSPVTAQLETTATAHVKTTPQPPTPTPQTVCPVPMEGVFDDVPKNVSGRVTAVLPEAIKVDSASHGEVIVELWPFARIWKGDYVSADALERGAS